MADYLKYTHTNVDENTVLSFFNRNKPYTDNLSLYLFLIYEGDSSKSNISRIYDKYSEAEKAVYKELYDFVTNNPRQTVELRYSQIGDLPLHLNTELLIPTDELKTQLVAVKGKNMFLKQNKLTGFWSEKLVQLLSDPLYVPSENMGFKGNGNDVEMINENIMVWVWCRALNKIINVSPFIQSCSTSKGDVGSFNISLSPLDEWSEYYDLGNGSVLNNFNVRNTNGTIQPDFFHRNFQQNDIVFIRFERLKAESKNGDIPTYPFEVDKTNLPGQIWDMIGLLDYNEIDPTFSTIEYNISLVGRDFLKLLIEDGSYIFNIAYLVGENSTNLIYGMNKESNFFKRIYSDPSKSYNKYQYSFVSGFRGISDSLGFIVNQISNLGVLGDVDLFSQYKNKRTQTYKVTGSENDKTSPQLVNGVWQIIKFFVDDQLKSRVVADNSLAQSDGTLIEQFNKLCQEPFVEFYGDTYGDEFNFIVRQPPFTKDAIMSFLEKKTTSKSTLTFEDGEAKEVFYKEINNIQEYLIDIEEKDVSRLNLSWDETYYSWYQISPHDGYLKKSAYFNSGGIIPIVFFEEVANIWGNHRKVITDNYINSDFGKDGTSYLNALFQDLKFLIETNFYLPFTRKGTISLVKGDRRIKKGTFIRLKQTGEIFYVDSVSNSINFTGETGAADRTTTIKVSRGMIEKYIKGYRGWDHEGKIINSKSGSMKFSYFDIVKCNVTVKNVIPEPEIKEAPTWVTYTKPTDLDENGWLKVTSTTERYRYLVEKYFPADQVDNAMRIMQAESSGNPVCKPAFAPGFKNKKGKIIPNSRSWGLFQINDYYNSQYFNGGYTAKDINSAPLVRDIQNPEYNVWCAYRIYRSGGWRLWETHTKPGVLSNVTTQQSSEVSSVSQSYDKSNFDAKVDPVQWDFFLNRKQMNIYKNLLND